MSKPSESRTQADKPVEGGLDRRRFFMMGGSAVAAVAAVPLTGEAEAA